MGANRPANRRRSPETGKETRRQSCPAVTAVAPRAAGFTLLELLVVLGMLALSSAVVIPWLGNRPGVELRSAARELVSGARYARIQAEARKQPVTLTLDLEARTIAVSGTGVRGRLPPGIRLSLYTARSELVNEHAGAIRFFPDGTSTGGRITLLASNGLSRRVDVDWLTGRVKILEESPGTPGPVQ